jgi:hypothetical protein
MEPNLIIMDITIVVNMIFPANVPKIWLPHKNSGLEKNTAKISLG